MVALAVSLLLGIGRNHPFGQGNKRTAFEAADVFLKLNGYELKLPNTADAADLIADVITGSAEEEALLDLLARSVRPV